MIDMHVLAHLIRDEDYTRRVIPYLEQDYFETPAKQLVFKEVYDFTQKYKVPPSFDAVRLAVDGSKDMARDEALDLLQELQRVERVDLLRQQWLIDQTEKWMKERAVYLAVVNGLDVLSTDRAGQVPDMLRKALSVGFHTDIGHDYIDDAEKRFKFYHQKHDRLPFDLDMFNTITRGGLIPKTLNVCVAGTNVGKSLFLCHVATSALRMGKNVLYITLEMAEERIAQRIDANLLDIGMHDLEQLTEAQFMRAIAAVKERHSLGRLIIKEYPTGAGHSGHFRALMDELALKKGFFCDLLIIDYINICASESCKMGGSVNSYTFVKKIAEELRGLAVEKVVPLLTATQFNRDGFDNSDPSLTNTSESFGLPQTADLQFALITSEELDESGLLQVKQMKSRYDDKSKNTKFVISLDRSKMRLGNAPQGYLADAGRRDADPEPDYNSISPTSLYGFDDPAVFRDTSDEGQDELAIRRNSLRRASNSDFQFSI